MDINYSEWKFWLDTLQVVATILLGIYVFVTRKSQVNEARINQLENHTINEIKTISVELHKIDTRVTKVEQKSDPQAEIKEVHRRLNAITRDLSSLSGEFKQTSEAVKRIHDYMMTRGEK